MGIMEIGTRALQANQIGLQTAGNNIANVNTPGYSRQKVILQAVQGQFVGNGYVGKGVSVQTIQRNFSEFLTRQSTLAGSVASADTTRADKLKQLEGIFEGGASGLGASISDMLNSFADVASAPTDITARTVTLTRIDETAARLRTASQRLDDLQLGIRQELSQKVGNINSLAKSIAEVNGEIAKTRGQGQPPNDLLDRRDQLLRDLNQYVQTSSVAADDGSVSVFVGGSQALVLGQEVALVSVTQDEFGDPLKSQLAITNGNASVTLDESALGGGEVPGLLRFQNTDLNEGRNLLGRLTVAISSSVNEQHRLGLDLDGKPGADLFTPVTFNASNVLIPKQPPPPAQPVKVNTGSMQMTLSTADVTQFSASDYQIAFDSSGTAGNIRRLTDGVLTSFVVDPATSQLRFEDPKTQLFDRASLDGLQLNTSGTAGPNDRFLIKPFNTSAGAIKSQFSNPRGLAVASPVVGIMGKVNTGNLQQISIQARGPNPPNPPAVPFTPVVLTFTSATTYTRSDDPANTYTYTPEQAIEATLPDGPTPPLQYSNRLDQWSVKLQGTPNVGDTFVIQAIKQSGADLKLNSGAATAMANLRDVAMFDGAALTDGYAGLISQIGIRSQSADNAATVSTSIAASLEKDRTSVAGVNLDEEAAKLLQYQQAYQASAKMIQIAQNIFDTLIQGLAR
jgi:flagellar hook-associated protein 1 FlgK